MGHSEAVTWRGALAVPMHQYQPALASPLGVRAIDACVWARGYRCVAVIGASKNAGKTTALNALSAALTVRKERVGLCSVGVDGEATDAWLATPKPAVEVQRGMLVVTAQQALDAAPGRWKVLSTLPTPTSLGPTVLAEARVEGPVMLCGLAHRGHLADALAALRAAGADRVLVDGAYHRQAAADAEGVDALVLSVGALLPLHDALPTLRALSTPPDCDLPQTLDVVGGLTDARLALLNLTGVCVLRVASQGAVLLSSAGHARLHRAGVVLTARLTRPLVCLTVNPHQPDGDDDPAAFFEHVQVWIAQNGLRTPILDVVSGAHTPAEHA